MSTRTAKDLLIEAAENLPPDATIEDAIERLCFLAKIEHGIEQADYGKTVDHEEVRGRLGI